MREGDRTVEQEWTGDELDRALAGLYMDIKTDQRGLPAVRENLMTAADSQAQLPLSPRPLRRWLAAAAAVAVLVTGGVVAQTVLFSATTATAQARETLTSAAELAARATDPVPGRGRRQTAGSELDVAT